MFRNFLMEENLKPIKKLCFSLIILCLANSIFAGNAFIRNLTKDLNSASKEFQGNDLSIQQKKIFDDFIKANNYPIVEDKGKGKYKITFLYFENDYNKSEIPTITIFCDSHKEINGTALKNIKNTPVFYVTVTIQTDKNFLTYMIRKNGGSQMNDLSNDLQYCDRKKSSFIRLNNEIGGFHTYKLISKYQLMGTREIIVYLPAEYLNAETSNEKKFPVLYMLDGQNIWDNSTLPYQGWKVETSMEKLVQEEKIQSAIIVGITNTSNRTKEYAGWCNELPEGDIVTNPLEFKQYANEHRLMIIEEIIPFIEKKYNVISDRTGRIIAGSSYGAFCSAYFAAKNPEVFSGAGLFSGGSTGYEQIIAEDGFNFTEENKVKIYVDCGTGDSLEKILLPGTQKLKDYLLEKGYTQAKTLEQEGDFFYQECDLHPHNEKAWSRRIPDFLEFMFK